MTASDRLRSDLRAILEDALAAVDPRELVAGWLGEQHDFGPGGRTLHLLAVGKAAPAMARGALDALGDRIHDGIVLTTPGTDPHGLDQVDRLEVRVGGHPVPDERGVEAALAVEGFVRSLGATDTLLCLISGGGSALLTLPAAGLGLDDLRAATEALLRAGATIQELNLVRKHLEHLKGGRIARLADPARVLALLISDVIGDPLDAIASGPVSPDPTTFSEALELLDRLGVAPHLPPAVLAHLRAGAREEIDETPKPGDPCFERVDARILANNQTALDGAAKAARERGYDPRVLDSALEGEARDTGRWLAARALEAAAEPGPAICLLAGGETTVTVRGPGRGGRNQELALAAALVLDESDRPGRGAAARPLVMASIGTDGIDGLSEAAGATVDPGTIARARSKGLDPVGALERNDSDTFFRALGDHQIVTGPTGTNVMDVQVVLIGPHHG